MDSGYMASHPEFEGANIETLYKVPAFTSFDDDTGHGTSVLSAIVGKTFGVNSKAAVKIVKLFGAGYQTTATDFYTALDAVYNYHTSKPEVLKIVLASWSVANDPIIAAKITDMIEANLVVVAAAGNQAGNIDDIVPAGVPGVLTVAASNKNDEELYAVFGTARQLDLYARGELVGVASIDSGLPYGYATGSSISAALTAGCTSLIAGVFKTLPQDSSVIDAVKRYSTYSALLVNSNVSSTENRLLYRPDSVTLSADQDYYLGTITIGSDTPTLTLVVDSIFAIV